VCEKLMWGALFNKKSAAQAVMFLLDKIQHTLFG
jgi:hypothetical protein